MDNHQQHGQPNNHNPPQTNALNYQYHQYRQQQQFYHEHEQIEQYLAQNMEALGAPQYYHLAAPPHHSAVLVNPPQVNNINSNVGELAFNQSQRVETCESPFVTINQQLGIEEDAIENVSNRKFPVSLPLNTAPPPHIGNLNTVLHQKQTDSMGNGMMSFIATPRPLPPSTATTTSYFSRTQVEPRRDIAQWVFAVVSNTNPKALPPLLADRVQTSNRTSSGIPTPEPLDFSLKMQDQALTKRTFGVTAAALDGSRNQEGCNKRVRPSDEAVGFVRFLRPARITQRANQPQFVSTMSTTWLSGNGSMSQLPLPPPHAITSIKYLLQPPKERATGLNVPVSNQQTDSSRQTKSLLQGPPKQRTLLAYDDLDLSEVNEMFNQENQNRIGVFTAGLNHPVSKSLQQPGSSHHQFGKSNMLQGPLKQLT